MLDRRRFLALSAAGALAPGAVVTALAGETPKRRLLQLNGYAIDAETPLDLLDSYITENDLFFVRHHWNPTAIDPRRWALTIDGEVASPLRLTISDLKRMPAVTATCVLQCAGNGRGLYRPPIPGVQWRFGAVGNARWKGVRVKDILGKAGLRGSARHLLAFGADAPPGKVPAFHRSLEIEKALEDSIVAYEMNGSPLPALHGAPARLVVPGWAGDHWMKWLTRLSPSREPQTGFYMDTAYRYPREPRGPGVAVKPDDMSPVTELFVKSNFTFVPKQAKVNTPVELKGFAFSGAPDISRVDVSDDDGRSWQPGELSADHEPYAWRRWIFRWVPRDPGTATLVARATDSRGSIQPKEAVWNPSGYLHNGWHSVQVEVTA